MTVPLYALTDTWNASGTVWQGIELDVTDTGSDPTSVLFKLTRNSNNYFQIDEVGQTSISLGTITANAKALNITATWNNNAVTFDAPLFMNITNTASNAASLLMDLQVGSASKFSVTADAAINLSTSSNGPTTSVGIASLATSDLSFYTSGVRNLILSGTTLLGNTLALASNFGNYQLFSDTSMYRDAGAGLWGFARGANGGVSSAAATIRVYNTTVNINTNVAPTNYERAVFDWTTTANSLTIATQKGGTGSNRNIEFTSEGSTFIFSGNGLNPSI